MRGSVHVLADTSDRLFGFLFWGKRDDVASQVVYTGRVAYETDDSSRTYLLISKPGQINRSAESSGWSPSGPRPGEARHDQSVGFQRYAGRAIPLPDGSLSRP